VTFSAHQCILVFCFLFWSKNCTIQDSAFTEDQQNTTQKFLVKNSLMQMRFEVLTAGSMLLLSGILWCGLFVGMIIPDDGGSTHL
jgi:hypothetical protein